MHCIQLHALKEDRADKVVTCCCRFSYDYDEVALPWLTEVKLSLPDDNIQMIVNLSMTCIVILICLA